MVEESKGSVREYPPYAEDGSDSGEYYEGVEPWGSEVRFYPGYDIYGEIEPITKVYGVNDP